MFSDPAGEEARQNWPSVLGGLVDGDGESPGGGVVAGEKGVGDGGINAFGSAGEEGTGEDHLLQVLGDAGEQDACAPDGEKLLMGFGIAAVVVFGPWVAAEPTDTPLDGVYDFKNADLSVFKGIAGHLDSTGKFAGYWTTSSPTARRVWRISG